MQGDDPNIEPTIGAFFRVLDPIGLTFCLVYHSIEDAPIILSEIEADGITVTLPSSEKHTQLDAYW